MEGREDHYLSIVMLDFFVKFIDVSSLFKVFVAEEEITDQQFLNCFHSDAACDFLLTVCHFVLIHLHNIVKLFKNFGLTDGLGVLHLLHDCGISKNFIEAVQISVGAFGRDNLFDPLTFALIIFLFELSLDVADELVIDEAGAGDHEALDPIEVECADDHVALLEELVQRFLVDLVSRTLFRDVALNLLLQKSD